MNSNELSSGIKSVADVVRKGENIELYAKLIELYEKAIDLQEENRELNEKVRDRSHIESIRARIERHEQPFLTLQDDKPHIYYCAHCWDSNEKLIQLNTEPSSAEFICPSCKNIGVYDRQKYEQYLQYKKARRKGVTYY